MEITSNAALANKISQGNQIKKNNDEKLVQDIKNKINDHNKGNLDLSAQKKQNNSRAQAQDELKRDIKIKANQLEESKDSVKRIEIDRINTQKTNASYQNKQIGGNLDISV